MILIALLAIITYAQVSHDPVPLSVQNINFSPIIKTVPSNMAFKTSFPGLGYEIGATIYQTHNGLLSEQIHNAQFYNKSDSCQLYRSQLTLDILDDTNLVDQQTFQSIAVSEVLKSFFAIISDDSYQDQQNASVRTLISYQFNRTTISKVTQNVTVNSLGLNSSQSLDIMISTLGNILLVTDGIKIIAVNPANLSKHWDIPIDLKKSANYTYQFAAQNDLLKFDICHYDALKDEGTVLLAWDTALRIYEISGNASKATLTLELTPPANTYFTDAIADHGKYWALADGQLVGFRKNKTNNYQTAVVTLESAQCSTINKYETTVHIICKQGGLNYVGQYFLNESFTKPQQALKLNRYYTQIDDARLLFRFGGDNNPKLIISGDTELLMTPYAVNRVALLESEQIYWGQRIRSFGVQLIYSLPLLSNFTHSYALGISDGSIDLFIMVQTPPEMECTISRTSVDIRWNVLVELNSSSCPANGDWQQLQSICSYKMPFTLYASLIEVDATNHTTIMATVILLLLALAILIVGCGLYCKTNIQKAVVKIKQELKNLKKQKRLKPI